MLKAISVSVVMMAGMVAGATAQSLTPEQLQAMIDQRLEQQNPYQALLADPDPERSLAAMQIMLESGDQELIRLALEFGLLSPNPKVRRIAVEALLGTGPVLSLRLDGTNVKDSQYAGVVRQRLNGTLDSNGIGFTPLTVGPLSEDGTCFLDKDANGCRFRVNADGVFLSVDDRSGNPILRARTVVNDAGQLAGTATLYAVDEPVPITVQLLD